MFFFNRSLHKKLDLIIAQNTILSEKVNKLITQQGKTMLNLDVLRTQLEAETNAVTAAIALINALADEVRAAAGNQDAVNALADQFAAQAQALADAVAANTPAAPTA